MSQASGTPITITVPKTAQKVVTVVQQPQQQILQQQQQQQTVHVTSVQRGDHDVPRAAHGDEDGMTDDEAKLSRWGSESSIESEPEIPLPGDDDEAMVTEDEQQGVVDGVEPGDPDDAIPPEVIPEGEPVDEGVPADAGDQLAVDDHHRDEALQDMQGDAEAVDGVSVSAEEAAALNQAMVEAAEALGENSQEDPALAAAVAQAQLAEPPQVEMTPEEAEAALKQQEEQMMAMENPGALPPEQMCADDPPMETDGERPIEVIDFSHIFPHPLFVSSPKFPRSSGSLSHKFHT